MSGLFSDWKEKKVKSMLISDSICRAVKENGRQEKKKEGNEKKKYRFLLLPGSGESL